MIKIRGKYTTARVMIDELDEMSVGQIQQFVNHPAFTNPVVVMSDVHAGKGSVIGFTMPMTSKVIPNVVGVDIGCGMLSLNIGEELSLSLEHLDQKIRQRVPFGQDVHDQSPINMKNDFPWHRARSLAQSFSQAYQRTYGVCLNPPNYCYDWFEKASSDLGANIGRFIKSIGSLGGGNHFIETGVDQNGDHWITIHTGSRNWGKRVCERWQQQAIRGIQDCGRVDVQAEIAKIKSETSDGKEIFRRIKEIKAKAKQYRSEVKGIDINGREWLEGVAAEGYLFDMIFSQIYASYNRQIIAQLILEAINPSHSSQIFQKVKDQIETVHNFIDFQDWIIRKGAIRSYAGERMVIPFNMRDGILICEGKSNPEWNFSAPHGAGRVLSRNQARKSLSFEDFEKQMRGIYSTSVSKGTLDESPAAYKDAKMIEEAIEPTAHILGKIRPIHNMKDSGEFFYGKKNHRKSD